MNWYFKHFEVVKKYNVMKHFYLPCQFLFFPSGWIFHPPTNFNFLIQLIFTFSVIDWNFPPPPFATFTVFFGPGGGIHIFSLVHTVPERVTGCPNNSSECSGGLWKQSVQLLRIYWKWSLITPVSRLFSKRVVTEFPRKNINFGINHIPLNFGSSYFLHLFSSVAPYLFLPHFFPLSFPPAKFPFL